MGMGDGADEIGRRRKENWKKRKRGKEKKINIARTVPYLLEAPRSRCSQAHMSRSPLHPAPSLRG